MAGSLIYVGTHAITQGIATICAARHIILIAVGTAKADAVDAMLNGSIDRRCPATALRSHPDVTLFADRDALALHHQRSRKN